MCRAEVMSHTSTPIDPVGHTNVPTLTVLPFGLRVLHDMSPSATSPEDPELCRMAIRFSGGLRRMSRSPFSPPCRTSSRSRNRREAAAGRRRKNRTPDNGNRGRSLGPGAAGKPAEMGGNLLSRRELYARAAP